jgi:hypothetical protein
MLSGPSPKISNWMGGSISCKNAPSGICSSSASNRVPSSSSFPSKRVSTRQICRPVKCVANPASKFSCTASTNTSILPLQPKRSRVSKLIKDGVPMSIASNARRATSSSKHPPLSEPTVTPSGQTSMRAPGRR